MSQGPTLRALVFYICHIYAIIFYLHIDIENYI